LHRPAVYSIGIFLTLDGGGRRPERLRGGVRAENGLL
jgi:hypothetical protein